MILRRSCEVVIVASFGCILAGIYAVRESSPSLRSLGFQLARATSHSQRRHRNIAHVVVTGDEGDRNFWFLRSDSSLLALMKCFRRLWGWSIVLDGQNEVYDLYTHLQWLKLQNGESVSLRLALHRYLSEDLKESPMFRLCWPYQHQCYFLLTLKYIIAIWDALKQRRQTVTKKNSFRQENI